MKAILTIHYCGQLKSVEDRVIILGTIKTNRCNVGTKHVRMAAKTKLVDFLTQSNRIEIECKDIEYSDPIELKPWECLYTNITTCYYAKLVF